MLVSGTARRLAMRRLLRYPVVERHELIEKLAATHTRGLELVRLVQTLLRECFEFRRIAPRAPLLERILVLDELLQPRSEVGNLFDFRFGCWTQRNSHVNNLLTREFEIKL